METAMMLFQLSRDGQEVDYDECDSFVIAANSEQEARDFANEDAGGEGRIWNDLKRVSCVVIGQACSNITAGVILVSFYSA